MAIFDNFLPNVESTGVVYPQDYYIKTLNFLTSNGNKMEMKKLLLKLYLTKYQ